MELIAELSTALLSQFHQPTLAFLIGGMLLAALGSKLEVPAPVYKFVVMLLLLKVGLGAGISVREADLDNLLLPALMAGLCGIAIVIIGAAILGQWRGLGRVDAFATAGLFGAVSASTLAAGMATLDDAGMAYEGFIGALYPFMDIAALLTAIVLARTTIVRNATTSTGRGGSTTAAIGGYSALISGFDKAIVSSVLIDTLKSPAISALLLGLGLGILSRPDSVFESFYEPLFRGLLSILMLVMGMEAWSRLSEMRKVAHVYVLYGIAAPFINGFIGFGAGMIANHYAGFSQGGVVLLAVMAASSSDISGPPTLRAALPEANPSAYLGTSTGIGTPVAILSIPFWIMLAEMFAAA